MVDIKYFVHGTTTDNLAKRATGWLPGELSEKGIAQAKALAETIKDEEFDVVFCSDLKRAIDSAHIDFAGRDIKIITDARLRECNYGDLDGKDSSLVVYADHINCPFPNGESLKDVEVRMKNFVKHLSEHYDGRRVAIIAHRAPQLALDVITKGYSWDEAIQNDWRNTKDWKPGWDYVIVPEKNTIRVSSRAVIIQDGKLLTMFRHKVKNDKIIEYYVIPGGGLDEGETLESNVIRELREEMNIDIKVLGYLGVRKDDKLEQHYFHCEIERGTPELGGEELDRMTDANYYEPMFIPLDELGNIDILGLEFVEKAQKNKYLELEGQSNK